MARNKSVILTKEEKKAAVANLKSQIKAVKEARKGIDARRKEADKAFNAASKQHVTVLKTTDKELAANTKVAADLEAKLAALNPAPAPATA